MNLQEIKEYTAKERIKAYIYFGIDAEMDMIDNKIEKAQLKADTEKNIHEIEWYERHQETFEAKIKHANERIEDLEVYLGAMK